MRNTWAKKLNWTMLLRVTWGGIGLLVLVPLGLYIWRNADDFVRLAHVPGYHLAAIILLSLAPVIVPAANTIIILSLVGTRFSLSESTALTMIGQLLNYLPLNSGYALRAAYLKVCHRLYLSHFFGLHIGLVVASLVAFGALGVITRLLALFYGSAFPLPILVFFLLLLTSPLFLVILVKLAAKLKPIRHRSENRLSRLMRETLWAWKTTQQSRGEFAKIVALNLAMFLLLAVRMRLSFAATGSEISFAGAALCVAWGGLSGFLNLTPGSLGVKEGMVALAASSMGYSPAEALVAASLNRIVQMGVALATAPWAIWRARPLGKSKGLSQNGKNSDKGESA